MCAFGKGIGLFRLLKRSTGRKKTQETEQGQTWKRLTDSYTHVLNFSQEPPKKAS